MRKKIIFHETSSFRSLTSRSFYPDAVLWTNFSSDHLDYHRSDREYFMAKLKRRIIVRDPGNVMIGSSVWAVARKFGIKLNPKFQVIGFTCRLAGKCCQLSQSIPQLENLAFAVGLGSRELQKQNFRSFAGISASSSPIAQSDYY